MDIKKAGFVLLIIIGLAGYRIYSRHIDFGAEPSAGADVALIVDNSASQNIDCAEFSTMVRTALSETELGKKSELSVFTLGSSSSSYEPVRQLDFKVEKGQAGIRKAARKAEKACHSFSTVDGSSIFRAVQVVLEQLQSRGMDGDRVFLMSDLEENISKLPSRKTSKKTAPLRNQNIAVEICGVAATNEGGGPRGPHAIALQRQWLAQFAEPKGVKISPYCAGQLQASN